MRWNFIKKFPKLVLVAGVLVGSTIAFGIWWFSRTVKTTAASHQVEAIETSRPKLALIEEKPDHLLLIDNDLYDLDTGTLLFSNWLAHAGPNALFFDHARKKIIARYERGYVRYSLNGKEEASLGNKFPTAFSDDLKWAVYVKERDLWRADIDWSAFTLQNDRRLTSIEQFNDQVFANVILSNDNVAVVRNLNQLLRVNLETGEVKPTRIPSGNLAKGRSPNGRYMVGIDRGQFYCYDVESDDSKTVAVGKGVFNDYQWLGNDKCAAIAAMKTVVLYDRQQGTLIEIATLPTQCFKIGEPSPDGRYVFCLGRGNGFLVDLQSKAATPIAGGAGVTWINDTTFAFARELPDSELRGTWLQTVEDGERRNSNEPFLVSRNGPMMLASPSGLIVYVTKHTLTTMRPDGTGVDAIIKFAQPPEQVVAVDRWTKRNQF
jgi:hypothetical protein